jgi:hypothetical protein
MERLQAFNYALQPNGEQARRMRRFAESCRFVFNKALDIQQKNHEAPGKKVSQKSGLNRAIIARPRLNLRAWNVAMKTMPMWSARSLF